MLNKGCDGLACRYLPIVPLPPILKRPNRLKGAEQVTILDVMSRMIVEEEGLAGMSLEVMVGSEYEKASQF